MRSTIANKPSGNSAKPFLKWAGGKGQVLPSLRDLYPDELSTGRIKNYIEPFVGGGAVFFDIAQKYKFDNIWLFDINPELILTYRVIKHDVNTLLDFLARYENNYLQLNKQDRKDYYYEIRETFNLDRFDINYNKYADNWISRAAQIIFLNKTCYNGLFRFNNSGGFNTPAGDYVNPKICDTNNLLNVARLLEGVHLRCDSFENCVEIDCDNTFVYFDPPYRPLSKTSNFTSYSKHEFNDHHQAKLADVYSALNNKGYKLMLSNSDPKNTNKTDNFFDDLYKDYTITRIPARRNINSNAKNRGVLSEIVVTNYTKSINHVKSGK